MKIETSCFTNYIFRYILITILAFSLIQESAFGAERYWVAGVNSNFNNAVNWSATSGGTGGAGVPTDADMVIFDVNGLGDCTLDVNIDVFSIEIKAGFAGTMNQGAFEIITRTFSQAAGTFAGASGDMDINGSFELSGGSFICSSNNTFLRQGFTYSGGTFDHNNGHFYFDDINTSTVTSLSDINFYDVTIDKVFDFNGLQTFLPGFKFIINGSLSLINGGATNMIFESLTGDVVHDAGYDGGNSSVIISPSANATINLSSGFFHGIEVQSPNVTINPPAAGSLEFASSVIMQDGVFTATAADLDINASLEIKGGSFTCSSNKTFLRQSFTYSGGTFDHNNGHFYFDDINTSTVTSSSDIDFYDVTIDKVFDFNGLQTFLPGLKLIINGSLSFINGGALNMIFESKGDVQFFSTWDGGASDLVFTGSNPQSFDLSGAADKFTGNIEINKSAQSVELFSELKVHALKSLHLEQGSLELNGNTLEIQKSQPSGITRTNGMIVSETTDNGSIVKWNIGTTSGPHEFPFGTTNEEYIPVIYERVGGGGDVSITTYMTAPDNTPLPTLPDLVNNLNVDLTPGDDAGKIADRFWQIDVNSPATANVTLTANVAEVGIITDLQAHRWDNFGGVWQAPLPGQVSNPNSVFIPNITDFSPWILSGTTDSDGDGVDDDVDNCVNDPNPDQADLDIDGIGDVCDPVVNVEGAGDALIDQIEGLDLPDNLENVLIDKAEKAQLKCAEGTPTAAVGNLTAFINKVESKRGKDLTDEQADALIAVAQMIIDAIENGNADCGSPIVIKNKKPTQFKNSKQSILSVYPNPFDLDLTIFFQSQIKGTATAHLFSVSGKQLIQSEMTNIEIGGAYQIKFENPQIPNGVYLVQLIFSDGQVIHKRVVRANLK